MRLSISNQRSILFQRTTNDVIILPVNQQIIDKTMKNVVKKLNHTNISLMFNRTPVELLDNLYIGDLAKNAL